MSTFMKRAKFVLRILLGAFFIFTAVCKLLSLDNFEIYIYSFQLFGFNFSSFLARCIISAELLLGSLLIAKILYRPVWWTTMAMLTAFTLLLGYVVLFRQDTNCHCMGDIVQMRPGLSIVKNLVTMALLLVVRKEQDYHFKGKVAVGIVLVVLSIAAPFGLFPMDSLYNLFDKKEKQVNESLMADFMQDSIAQLLHLEEGNYMLGFLASGCKYCQVSALKVKTMVDYRHVDPAHVIFFIWGDEEAVEQFKQKTETTDFQYVIINPVLAVNLVMGQFPTYVMTHNGEVEQVMDLRGLNENEIAGFLDYYDE